MILKNDAEVVYNYVKNNLPQFTKDGSIHLSYELLVPYQYTHSDGKVEELLSMQYGKLITNTVYLKQDIIETMKKENFFSFLYTAYSSPKEYYKDLHDNSIELTDDDLKELLNE